MSYKRNRSDLQGNDDNDENTSFPMEYSFDIKTIVNKQKRLEFVLDKCIQDGTVTDYDTLKYKEVTYKLGEYVELHDAEKVHPYVAKLKRIVKVPSAIERMPFLQVEWCLNKGDLPKAVFEDYSLHMSDAEVFPSQKSLFCVYVDSIKCKCFVLSYEEYTEMATSYEYYYFSRAIFDEETESLVPAPENWKRQCVCDMPVNPDLIYVQCEYCRKWFHDTCIGDFDMNKTYVCDACSK